MALPTKAEACLTSADYLVVGSGAMGMAFADTILTETSATIAIVDRHHQPGGHWNDADPFVRLHQPSSFYRVNSMLKKATENLQRLLSPL